MIVCCCVTVFWRVHKRNTVWDGWAISSLWLRDKRPRLLQGDLSPTMGYTCICRLSLHRCTDWPSGHHHCCTLCMSYGRIVSTEPVSQLMFLSR